MILQNSDKAVIEIEKLRDYCLNTEHPIGKHKANMFKKLLDLTSEDSYQIRDKILDGIKKNDAFEGHSDNYGKRFYVDIKLANFDKNEIVRTLWIIKHIEDFPRFISCYIKK